ncbi:Protein SRG1, partial [Mucuna pruriens]
MDKVGTSLLVPSVQELAKQPIIKVPEQYLHPNQDPPVISNTALPQVPVIDLNKLLSEDVTELEKLDQACKEWGFFQLINHGVNPSIVENMKKDIKEFLTLPMGEKKQFWQTPEELEGFGQLFVVSEDQKLEWADLFFINILPKNTRNPRLFPRFPQQLRDNLENYSSEVKKLCLTIIERMAIALKIEPNELVDYVFEDLCQSMRWNYYPPCPQPENVIGINPHSDAGALTILLQVNETEGLQIKKDGKWIPVKPLPNAFVVNVGDMLEILTNGIYRSIEHRATINSEKERISIATFHRPRGNREIGPTPSLVTSERAASFKRIVVADYYKAFFSRELQGKSCLDFVRIQNEIVPCVQELAKQPITKVPEQYLRPNIDPPLGSNTTSLPHVPIIDLNKLLSEDVIELEKLDHACKEWGFFQLINHGVNPSLVENMKRSVQEFFNLPMEEKKQFWSTPEDLEGFGHFLVDQKFDWIDPFTLNTLPLHIRNPRLFPRFPQPLRANLENYSLELGKLCITIIERMTIALKIEPKEVLELFENLCQAMRWNYYPPCPQPENVIGLDPHSDVGALTILLQINEIEGLQIKKDGKWIPVKSISNAFVINVGDTLEIITNGIYRSIEHRAIVNSKKERISIATFHRPQMNKVIGPTPSLVTAERPALFKQISAGDYFKLYFSRKPQEKQCLDSMRIKNDT